MTQDCDLLSAGCGGRTIVLYVVAVFQDRARFNSPVLETGAARVFFRSPTF